MAYSINRVCGRLNIFLNGVDTGLAGLFGVSANNTLRGVTLRPLNKHVLLTSDQKKQIHSWKPLLGTTKLDMPSLSPTMEKGNIVKWLKKEGDAIAPGDVLCEIETDKAIIAMDTEEEGILAKILVPDDTKDVAVGQLIALMVDEGDDWQNVSVPAADIPTQASAQTPPQATPTVEQSTVTAASEPGHLMGPSVKKLLQEHNLQAASVQATGPSGALLKGDVLNYIKTKNISKVEQTAAPPSTPPSAPVSAKPAPPPVSSANTNYIDIPLTNMRRVIAKRLTESKATIPHAYASIDSDMGAVTELRQRLKAEGIKVSVNDFIIKASAFALQRVSKVNATWNNGARISPTVDISVAVATPTGLITPIVKGATFLSVDQISETVKELAGRAKIGKLKPEEYQGGSFSISNLGMFGVSEFTAVINPPQVAIMAIGGSRSVAQEDGESKRMTVTLSYDSRALDMLDVTRFLEEFRYSMENPQTMLAGTKLDEKAEAFAF